MIKSQDLRVGNLYIDYDNRIQEVDLLFFELLNQGIDLDELIKEPIPLTEEILLKVGFFKDNIYSGLHSKIGALEIKIRFNSKIAYCEIGGIYFGDRFKYLHEMQNVWHSMSGQELNTAGLI